MSLNWFQRFFEEEFTGTVKRRSHVAVQVPARPPAAKSFPGVYIPGEPARQYDATLYEIEDSRGSARFAGFYGHTFSPSEGDEVEMRVSRLFSAERGTRKMNTILGDGSTKVVKKHVAYRLVNRYKILKSDDQE